MRRSLYVLLAVGVVGAGCGLAVVGTGAVGEEGDAAAPDGNPAASNDGSNAIDGGDGSTTNDGAILDAGECDADLDTSATNCGACGHSCLGATCTGGLCAPAVVVTYTDGVRSVAANSTRLYFSNDTTGIIGWVPLSSLSATPQIVVNSGSPCQIAVTDADLYWVDCDDDDVVHAGLDGSNSNSIVSNIQGCIFLGPDNFGYVPSFDGDFLLRFDLGTPSKTSVVLDGSFNVVEPWGIAATTSDIFWTNSQNGGAVYHQPFDGGAAVTVGKNQGNPNCISFADGLVYWPDYNSGEIHRAGPNGGNAQTLATGLTHPTSVTFDPSYIYWNSDDKIMRVAR